MSDLILGGEWRWTCSRLSVHIFNFNLFCFHLIHRGYDPSDMELINTEIRLQISYLIWIQHN